MAEYKCLADLQGKTLKRNDVVYLKSIRHTVDSRFLKEEHTRNDKIFDILSIPSKEEFATNAYGYDCHGGAWPECNRDDYEALTRLVIELYKIIEEKTSSITPEKEQWYKITTPRLNGISPEEVKALITEYGGLINSDFCYDSALGVYVWTKNRKVECLSKLGVREDAIEVSPTTKITTIKQEEKHENQFQRKKARIERGTRPEGSTVRGRRSKASVAVGHLGYRKVTGI